MKFELIREKIAALPRELPEAPAILTPIRLDTGESAIPGGVVRDRGKPAAVLVLLYPDDEGEARVLLTVRVPHLSTHAGEVSFPGGSAEESDCDPIETALREASEEVGLDPNECGLSVTGVLETFALTVSGFSIHPVVALADRVPATQPNPAEVARVIHAPLEAFLPNAPVELEERAIRERLIRFGVYPVHGERIWGATARMLGQLGAALAAAPSGRGAGVDPETAAAATSAPATETAAIRTAAESDRPAIDRFLAALAPELAHNLPPATELLVAEFGGRLVGVASWAPWDRDRTSADPRGFEGLTLPEADCPAELTLLAVAPSLRGRGIGRGLTAAAAEAAGKSHCTRLLAWTLADAACHPSSLAARAFFRANGFTDVAVDRVLRSGGDDRLLLARKLA